MSNVQVEVSARHVHLSQEHLKALFGEDYQLEADKPLSQPGEFLSKSRVRIVGKKRSLENVAVLGPVRKDTQIELSMTDCFAIGVPAPVRISGDIEGTPGVTLETEHGSVTLDKGLVVAKRHIHMTTEDAAACGVNDKDIVSVKVDSQRPLVFGGVEVRVKDSFKLFMHIDTDEANAAGIGRDPVFGEIIKE